MVGSRHGHCWHGSPIHIYHRQGHCWHAVQELIDGMLHTDDLTCSWTTKELVAACWGLGLGLAIGLGLGLGLGLGVRVEVVEWKGKC